MSKFKLPEKSAQPAQDLDNWVAGKGAETPAKPVAEAMARPSEEKLARLTIDLPRELHRQFKTACAAKGTKMIDEVRSFIEGWTQKNR
jgi:hypothetical protein